MKKNVFFAMLLASQLASAGNLPVKHFRYAGPFPILRPVMIDSIDVNKKAFDNNILLDATINLMEAENGMELTGDYAPSADSGCALHLLQFQLTNTGYVKAKINIGKMKFYQLYVDGKRSDPNVTLLPATHSIVIKYLTDSAAKDTLDVSIDTEKENLIQLTTGGKRSYTMTDVLNGKHFRGTSLSASGRYLIVSSNDVIDAKTNVWSWTLKDLKTGNTLFSTPNNINWMPNSDSYWFTRQSSQGRQLVSVDVQTGKETIIASDIPSDGFRMSPTADFLIFSKTVEGPKDDSDVHQFIHPDDRQPGWRNRTVLQKYDIKSGLLQPLTFGCHSTHLLDISRDGRYILYMVASPRLTKRPTTLFSVYRMDLQTMTTEEIISRDGFISSALFSPDAKSIVVMGSPEAFDGIGKDLPEGVIPSMVDNQLYRVDCQSRTVTPLTKRFNPSIENVIWNEYDNKIYFTALDRDYKRLYRMDAFTGKTEILTTGEDMVNGFSLADKAPKMAYFGQGASNTDRLYSMDLKSRKSSLLEDCHRERFHNVAFGECRNWDFINSRGDTICGRYYLPPHFDKTRKYPMIVNYYGGCSPTSRNFESRYPHHLYAAMGYVVYVLQPSGATGFGQEFSSRHVNTAGEGPAQDIIEGTRRFCEQHDFVNSKKIGCIGASYGGFMSQYLQTKTDIFAAAISHAGISNHTSYWGEGFWGYSYSEVSMANSYPWTRHDLYIDRSPLFNVEKIHTPLLFLHGVEDNNVPVGESIQMYNALRLLGRPTAFVVVEGEDHHILTYDKRVKWQNTIFAWFAKWLQDDASWWNSMYDKMPE